ncbi:MAG TPA: hypothetical protein VMJ12_17695 [Candidatus Acidoferrales bacterium]|nr:hypothetical protein [Candidatus Acidoferrales bacterium]
MQTKPKPSTWGSIRIFGDPARLWRTLRLAGGFALAAALSTACATSQPTSETQDVLLGSGFKMVTPSTPEQQALLKKLPPGRFTVLNRKGKTWYVFPDIPRNQAYVGTSDQYQSFQVSYQDEQLTGGQIGAANVAMDSAEWDAWDALGVWGGPY